MKRSGYTEIISVDQGLAEDNLSAEPSALCIDLAYPNVAFRKSRLRMNDSPPAIQFIKESDPIDKNFKAGNKKPGLGPVSCAADALFGSFYDFTADRTINQLDVRHGGVVASAETALQDAQVAARTVGVALAQVVEQLANGSFRTGTVESQATVGDAVFLARVISGSATRRSSLALGRVVLISSCSNSDTAMFWNIALRCALVRLR